MRFNADEDAPIVARKYSPRVALPIPPGLIDSSPSIVMTINAAWYSHISGILNALDQPDAWQGTAEQIEDARAEIRRLIANAETSETIMTMPLGLVVPYVGKIASLPAWMLLCDGTVYNRVDYPDLYEALEDAFILDADTFFVPQLNGRVPMGTDGDDVGDTLGSATHTLTSGEMPAHVHKRGVNDAWILEPNPLPPGLPQYAYAVSTTSGVFAYQKTNTGSTGGGGAHNNIQPSIKTRYAIVAVHP